MSVTGKRVKVNSECQKEGSIHLAFHCPCKEA